MVYVCASFVSNLKNAQIFLFENKRTLETKITITKLFHNFQKSERERQRPALQETRAKHHVQVLTPIQCHLQWILVVQLRRLYQV